jgi:hypothetical protein
MFGFSAGHFIVSAERLTGAWAWNESSTQDLDRTHTEDKSSGAVINLLWSNSTTTGYELPRVALDGRLGPITLGGSLGYSRSSGSSSTTTTTIGSTADPRVTDRDLPKFSAFVLTPRVGWVIAIGDRMAVWARAGITYLHSTSESTILDFSTMPETSFTRTVTSSFTALTLDPQFVVFPVPHFGFALGGVADIGLGGSQTFEESASPSGIPPAQTWDNKLSVYGASVGVMGIF